MIDKLPSELARAAQSATVDERRIGRLEGIINSMTPQERAKPELLKASRKRRIAAGGVREQYEYPADYDQSEAVWRAIGHGSPPVPRFSAPSRHLPAAGSECR